MNNDGYYYRDSAGVQHGPVTRDAFDSLQVLGTIRPGVKVWRQSGGSFFKVTLERRFDSNKACTGVAAGHACHCVMMGTMIFMMLFLTTIPKLREDIGEELSGHHILAFFFISLVLVTAGLTYWSMRKNIERVTDASTEVFASEV